MPLWSSCVLTFLLSDGGVLAVGQRTGGAVAHPGDVVFVPTETLVLGPDDKDNIGKNKAAITPCF